MEYNFREIEKKWQQYWSVHKTFKAEVDTTKPKYYVLDMFPYPSGAGLHVGHPLGYIASDIYSRYKRLMGFNVLHPMGYDSFGLPAEQYAIKTGQHPAITTEKNIAMYRSQMDKIGFSFDWDREVRTSDPEYYKWTQWIFIQLFNHWYNNETKKAEPIQSLITEFEQHGNTRVNAACGETFQFHGAVWNGLTSQEQQEVLLNYRLAYLAETMVNWCPELGTVLANDEVKEGVSVRGGHPVVQKKMKQWLLRVTAYAERLLNGLDNIDWSDSLKEIQRNWVGRSEGAEVYFQIQRSTEKILVYTTRPDTIFGATFMVIAPESPLVKQLITEEQEEEVENYVHKALQRTERERITDGKNVSGVFTGSYCINPFTQQPIPVWISEYVLGGYGTGAIMAVPAHDSRDYAFAKHFNLPIIQVIDGAEINEESYDDKSGKMINSGFLNGMEVKEAIGTIIDKIETEKMGVRKVNYRLRDAIFSRQRYWGEPFPVYYTEDGLPVMLPESELPLALPAIDSFLPTEKGEPPLARAKEWQRTDGKRMEYSTMPGFAGSSAYYIRYMDPRNHTALVSKEAVEYWQDVDLYVGGTEHAVGHLIYSRFWNKFLFDLGVVVKDEPFKKLINQGMIQGRSNFVYRINARKYAEYLIENSLANGKTGFVFKKDYKIGDALYNFVCEEQALVLELRPQRNTEEFYAQAATSLRQQGFKLLVLSYEQIVDNPVEATNKIQDALGAEFQGYYSPQGDDFAPVFVSLNLLKPEYMATAIHVDVNIVHNDVLDLDAFRKWSPEYKNAHFILENGKYLCGTAVEKMSKSMFNVVNPDDIVEQYGADTLRLYEMFLGPIEQAKPWDTNGIEGVHKFLRKFWRLYHDADNAFVVTEEEATEEELRTLHKTIKKVQEDIERFSFNTSVSAFMICVNELGSLKCNKRQILEPLMLLLAPFAPHITEEIGQLLGYSGSLSSAQFPVFNEEYLKENTCKYPVSFNGKVRFDVELPADYTQTQVQDFVLAHESTARWIEGKTIKKVIVVPKRIVNIVIG